MVDLGNGKTVPIFSLLPSFKEELLQLDEMIKEKEKLRLALTEQALTVTVFDWTVLADGLLNIANAAKTLQISPNNLLFSYMNQNRWIYKRADDKNWVAYKERIQQGHLIDKISAVQTIDGRMNIVEQVFVTPSGLLKLAKIFGLNVAA